MSLCFLLPFFFLSFFVFQSYFNVALAMVRTTMIAWMTEPVVEPAFESMVKVRMEMAPKVKVVLPKERPFNAPLGTQWRKGRSKSLVLKR